MDDPNPFARLQLEESEALKQLKAARDRFNRILAETPGGVPQPDASLRIQRAGAEVRKLNRQAAEANQRLMDYLMHGRVPEAD
jgi:hypothetical protein